MIEPAKHPMEKQRIEALRATNLLDGPIDERFERVTRMVCRMLNVPIAIFNLVDEDRQHYKSVQGLASTNAAIQGAFCTHTILEDDMLVVPNAQIDRRFHDNPFVTGEKLDLGFYAGCPVRTPNGLPIGTLCAIDRKPREMSEEDKVIMRDLASMLETELRVVSLSRSQQELIRELHSANMQAMVDHLTRVWNRTGILKILGKEWSEAVRHRQTVSLVMCDIDNFKAINDIHGYKGGDQVLQKVAKKLLEVLRGEDAVGRMGGGEFLLVLSRTRTDGARDMVERIRRAIEIEDFVLGERAYPVTMSFGVHHIVPEKDMTMDKALQKADDALYRAKRTGRNCVQVA